MFSNICVGFGQVAIVETYHRISVFDLFPGICVGDVLSHPRFFLTQPSFYFPGILVGPYLDYPEYLELINETMFQHAHVKATVKAGRTLPPGRKRAAYTKMVMGLIYLGAFVVLGPTYNFNVALKPEFAKYSLLQRIIRFQIGGPIERAKYYAIWTLTEVRLIFCSFGKAS